MIDMRLSYGAGIFVNAQDIDPTPETMNDLLALFRDKGLVPTIFYELRPGLGLPGQSIGLPGQPRVRLANPSNEWAISFATNRIDVNKNPTDLAGSNLGDLASFSLQAMEFFERITNKFGKKANRLVLDSSSLLREMTQEQLGKVYKHLFIPPQFYQEYVPFEWIWRTASRKPITITDLEDKVNVITTLQRIRGGFTSQTNVSHFDRIQLALDINTTDLNLEYRFGLSHMKSFLEQAPKIHESLCAEILGYIDG